VTTFNQQWDTGYLIGMAAAGFFVIAGLACFITGGIRFFTTDDTYSASGLVAVIGGFVAVGAFIGLAFAAWPLDGQYHRYQPLGGTVVKVGSRLIASGTSGGGSTQKFVLTFKGGQSLGCNDTRCSNVDVGDQVTLMCERAYQFNAPSPGWDCNWGQDRKPGGALVP
jgi:hypothetical protein